MVSSAKPVLLIEDTASLQMVYTSVLRNAGYDVVPASSAAEGLQEFIRVQPELVLLDLMLPDRDGLELIGDMLAQKANTYVVVITSNGSINRAVEAMRARAYDFLVKPFDEKRLLSALRNAQIAASDNRQGIDPPRPDAQPQFTGFIGSSQGMRDVYDRVGSVAKSMATVFLAGESGTGKEVCAQAIHAASARAAGPFIALNCAAIPSDLLESEVFGHVQGAFVGAVSDKIGAAAAADGGTLFLDEICEMDLILQAKLLRFIQTSTIQPLGSSTPRKVSARIICATNRQPMEEVRAGRFREDLYYRLYVVPIVLPPLRDRGRDAVEIAEGVLKEVAAEEGKVFFGLSAEVQAMFATYSWPGNVRQLLNVVRNVVVLHDGPVVTPDMLPVEFHDELADAAAADPVVPEPAAPPPPPADPLEALSGLTLAEIERRVIEAVIERHDGSVPRAARELGVSPSTIYRKREAWD